MEIYGVYIPYLKNIKQNQEEKTNQYHETNNFVLMK